MNYDFFADKTDKLEIIKFIFHKTDLQIYDMSSPYGQEIFRYTSVEEIASKFDLINGDKFALTFQLWAPIHKGHPLFKKIDLDPKRCNGHLFRYTTEGWGLIQLYLGGLKNNELNQSHIGHFTEKQALKWEGANPFNGPVKNWAWSEIQQTSQKLRSQIHNKMAIRKLNNFGILEGADKLEKAGIKLR